MATKPKTPTTAVVKAEPAPVATALPDFLLGSAGLGNENVTSKDVSLPRLSILQPLSPQLDKADPKFVKGAEAGDVINTLTGEVVCKEADTFRVLDVLFQKVYGLFKLRAEGGGFRGQFNTEREAQIAMAADPESGKLEIVETAIHVCLLLNEAGMPAGEVGMFYTKSGLKASRTLNGLLKSIPAARFASVVEFSIVREKNEKGSWYAFKPALRGFVQDKAVFDRAKAFYEAMKDATVAVNDVQPEGVRPDADESF